MLMRVPFYVQTAAALSDGMIRVSVYLKDADNLAGIDAELFLILQRFHLKEAALEIHIPARIQI